MGLLDNSTNNILVDAVLTEKGRELFASNGANLDDAGLVIVKFGVADDEVDYGNLTKYGLELGRERIEKLTPVFEASTNSQLAIRNFLTTFSDDDLLTMPRLEITTALPTGVLTLRRRGTTSKSVTFKLSLPNDEEPSVDQIDPVYLLSVPGRFITVEGQTPFATLPDRSDIYEIPSGGTEFSLTFREKPFSEDLFDTFAIAGGDPDTIKTRVTLTGTASGATLELPVHIERGQ